MQNLERDELYPLKFSTLAKEKVWGGHRLAKSFREGLPADRRIGEIWLVWDQLQIEDGPLRGVKLADLIEAHPEAILGSRLAQQVTAFPHLVKLIDAQEQLSVQVHPTDEYAQQREGEPFGKAEAWYIVDAEPDARLIHGVKTPLTRAEAEEAVRNGTLRDLVQYVHVTAGDVVMNPAGTVHAIGGGILLYEIQQSSDLTYRLYDWDRHDPNRPLHIEKSLDVADLQPLDTHKVQPVDIKESGGTRSFLVACRYFAAEMLRVRSEIQERPAGLCFHTLTILQGTGSLKYGPSLATQVNLSRGDSVLVPAGLRKYELKTGGEPLMAIKAYVPDLRKDIVRTLCEQGIPASTIVQLGGDPRRSDLAQYAHSL
jgi:mannose-6-phosphate isomerase